MAKATSTLSLFPEQDPSQEQDTFGSWLSGFTDAEGCFSLYLVKDRKTNCSYPSANFSIKIRADDRAILEEIQGYFRVGKLHDIKVKPPGNRQVGFHICSLDDLVGSVIPHFRRFPLLAKKRIDFDLWERAVLLHHEVRARHRFGKGKGKWPRWDNEDMSLWRSLKEQMQKRTNPSVPKGCGRLAGELRFGDWLAGFIDGEGCFLLPFNKHGSRKTPRVTFAINLRSDDRPVLEFIRDYIGHGSIGEYDGKASLRVSSLLGLIRLESVLSQHPLRAKKKRDLVVWKKALGLEANIVGLPRRFRGGLRGFHHKWSEENMVLYRSYKAELEKLKKFVHQPGLFD